MIEKNIKDYLNLYLGCEVMHRNEKGLLEAVSKRMNVWDGFISFGDFGSWYGMSEIKPILRPLSDMTDEEKNDFELWSFEIMKEDLNQVQRNALKIKWYLYNHFDLFGLIEAGLAIDKTTIKKYENESRT